MWNVQQTICILQSTLCSEVCHNVQCESLYSVQCGINNVESSSAMTSDERWLHDWGSTTAFNQVSPFTQLGCWNTQMSPTIVFIRIRSPKLEQNLMSSQTKRSNASNRVSPFTQLGSLSAWLLKHSNVTNHQYLHQDQISKMGAKSQKSSHRGSMPSTEFHPYLSGSLPQPWLTFETLKCHQPITNVIVP